MTVYVSSMGAVETKPATPKTLTAEFYEVTPAGLAPTRQTTGAILFKVAGRFYATMEAEFALGIMASDALRYGMRVSSLNGQDVLALNDDWALAAIEDEQTARCNCAAAMVAHVRRLALLNALIERM
jgi:hypothetical protein